MTEEQIRKIQKFQLTSDIFFGKVLEDKLACREVVEIITGENIKIKEVKSQYSIRQLVTHSIILDINAETEDGRRIHLEMHPQKNEDHKRRMRYNTACVDVENLEKGEAYKKLPDVYSIYFSTKSFGKIKKRRRRKNKNRTREKHRGLAKNIENNITVEVCDNQASRNERQKANKTQNQKLMGIYKVRRSFENTGIEAFNGIHEYYVNLYGEGNTKQQTELLQYMLNSDGVLSSEAFPNLVKRVRFLKETKGGRESMCEIMEQEREEGREEGRAIGMVQAFRSIHMRAEEILEKLMEELQLSQKEAEKYL